MKKLVKVLGLLAMSLVLCLGVVAFAACDNATEETYFGQYHYSSYGHEYGIAVNVTVKGDKITKVEKVASPYVECSAPVSTWTEENVANWNNNLASLLGKYAGKTVDEVKAVTCSINGVDNATANAVSDDNLVITNATQGSARVLKAVQNALTTKAAAAKTVEGEYHYPNAYSATAPDYGVKVKVTVQDNKIFNVAIVESDYVEVTATWNNKATWDDNVASLLAAYNGKTVTAVKAVTCSINGVDSATENTVSDSALAITGATQGSARVLKAVQDALAKL